MMAKTALRVAVICEWGFLLLAILLDAILESSLPEQLQAYLEWERSQTFSLNEWFLLIQTPLFLIGYATASIGLLLLKRWSKWLYLIVLIFGFAPTLISGPIVEHAFVDLVVEVQTLLSGLILGIVFFAEDAVFKDTTFKSCNTLNSKNSNGQFNEPANQPVNGSTH